MPPKKDAQAEKERTTKLLIVLGVVMGLVVLVNFKRISKMFGGSSRGRAVVGRPGAAPRPGAARPGRAAPRSPGRSRSGSVSPDDIPNLDTQVKARLKSLGSKRPDVVPTDKLLYQTDNPFLPLGVNRKDLDRKARAGSQGAGVVAPDALFFRGIMQVGDSRYAIIERPDRKIPWYVQEGELLEGTNFRLQNISDDETVVTILDPDAKRDRDKIKTVPYSGLEMAKELGNTLAQVDEETAKVLEAAAKGAVIPTKEPGPKTQKADDDMLELFE